jgi:putative ABC transport system substrate-binding protein
MPHDTPPLTTKMRLTTGGRVRGVAALLRWLATMGMACTLVLPVGAQPVAKVYRVGYLALGFPPPAGDPRPLEAFRQGLRDSGWIEGRNLVVEYRFAEGRADRLPAMAHELVSRKVDVIAANPTPAAVAAHEATQTIPIVGMGLAEPVAVGLVASLAKPGGNVTGVTYSVGSDIYGKQLELLKQAVPGSRRVALLVNTGSSPTMPLIIDSVKTAAVSLGLVLHVVRAGAPEEFDAAFASMVAGRAESLLVIGDSMYFAHRQRLSDLAFKHRLPSMSTQAQWADAGGMMAYGPHIPELWRRGAGYVDRILRGTAPAQMPIEQPTRFELIVNLKTAAALGLTMPQPLLLSADQLIR